MTLLKLFRWIDIGSLLISKNALLLYRNIMYLGIYVLHLDRAVRTRTDVVQQIRHHHQAIVNIFLELTSLIQQCVVVAATLVFSTH